MIDESSSYRIEFDDLGRIRIQDAELADRLLRRATHSPEIEILIETGPPEPSEGTDGKQTGISEPLPLTNSKCPTPVNTLGCPNTMCPLTFNVRISIEHVADWAPSRLDK